MDKEELLKKLEEATTLEELEAIKAEIALAEEKAEEPKEEEPAAEPEMPIEQIAEDEEVVEDEPEEEKKEEISEDEERSLMAEEKINIRKIVSGGTKMEEERKEIELAEKRGADLKAGRKVTVSAEEMRSVTVDGGTVLVPKRYKNEIDEAFEGVSGIVDELNSIQLNGGESYSVPFEKTYDAGDYTEEGENYADVDVETDYVETGRAKITAYAEVTKEVKKLPDAKYDALVIKRVRDAIRKKIGQQVIVGAGTANTIKGIYNADTKVLPGTADITLTAINADTLNEIVFAYGGDEAVEGEQMLILSKADLKEFAKVKANDGRPVYKVTRNGQRGTIAYVDDGLTVNYIINSACGSLGTASEGDFTMVYGPLKSYEFPVFSDLEVEESTDYKFKQGIIAYRADVIVGGTVAKYNGFIRVKKGASI